MAKAKAGLSGTLVFRPGPPKKTRQGHGSHSKPRGSRKMPRGQGR